jgi:hypothetical protein
MAEHGRELMDEALSRPRRVRAAIEYVEGLHSQVLDDLGESAQPDARRDGAAPLRQQRPHLADGARDGGAVHTEPAGQHVMSGAMTQIHQCGQETVDEDELCFAPAPTARRRGRDARRA